MSHLDISLTVFVFVFSCLVYCGLVVYRNEIIELFIDTFLVPVIKNNKLGMFLSTIFVISYYSLLLTIPIAFILSILNYFYNIRG